MFIGHINERLIIALTKVKYCKVLMKTVIAYSFSAFNEKSMGSFHSLVSCSCAQCRIQILPKTCSLANIW